VEAELAEVEALMREWEVARGQRAPGVRAKATLTQPSLRERA